jgi:hypothetical protein
MMSVSQVIELARKHVHNGAAMQTSAELCLQDAIDCFNAGDEYGAAYHRALKSLGYSVGILHSDYQRALSVKS